MAESVSWKKRHKCGENLSAYADIIKCKLNYINPFFVAYFRTDYWLFSDDACPTLIH